MAYDNPGKKLRQKAINLIYLILMAFLFSYIPSDFLDSVQHSSRSLDMLSKDAGKENTETALYFLNLLKDDPELYEKTKQKFLDIEDFSQEMNQFVERLKLDLISKDGVDSFGYFNQGKKTETTQELLISNGMADSVMHLVRNYKEFITEIIGFEHLEPLNEMFPVHKIIQKSDGSRVNARAFYFAGAPLNISVMNLNHFKAGMERLRIYAYEQIIRNLVEERNQPTPLKVMQNFKENQVEQIGNANTIREFFENIQNKEYINGKDEPKKSTSLLYVQSASDTIYPEGHPFKFEVYFDTSITKRVTILVNGPQDNRNFSMSKPGPFIYLPVSKGRYTVSFSDGVKKVSKSIRVIDVEPVIQNTKLSTIYAGIDNPLNIKTSEFGTEDKLVASISKGEIFRKGDKFYARVNETGIVLVSIFARMPYGIVKVAEQMFAVRALTQPIAQVNGFENGSKVNIQAARNMKSMVVKTDEYLVDETYFIQEFTVTMIYNKHTAITKPFVNSGSAFNPYLLDLLTKANAGDKLMITDIVAKSNLGNRIILNPYNLEFK